MAKRLKRHPLPEGFESRLCLSDPFIVEVDLSKSWERALQDVRFQSTPSVLVTAQNFGYEPREGVVPIKVAIKLAHFRAPQRRLGDRDNSSPFGDVKGDDIQTLDMLQLFADLGLIPIDLPTLLAFGAQHYYEDLGRDVAALGTEWKQPWWDRLGDKYTSGSEDSTAHVAGISSGKYEAPVDHARHVVVIGCRGADKRRSLHNRWVMASWRYDLYSFPVGGEFAA